MTAPAGISASDQLKGLLDSLKRLLDLLRSEWIMRAWFLFLILFTLVVAAGTLPGHISISRYVVLVFYSFVPGYSFVEGTLRKTKWYEKLVASFVFSIAFLMGIKALDKIIAFQTGSNISFLPTSPFEFGLVFSLTLVFLIYLAWDAFRRTPPQVVAERPKALIAKG